MESFIQFLVSFLSLGGIYALLALGLVVVFGLLGFLNFAHGDLMTLFGYFMVFALPPACRSSPRRRSASSSPASARC